MIIVRLLYVVMLALMTVWGISCSKSDNEKATDTGSQEITDSQLIGAALDDAVGRWRYRDKAALYDMEFEFYQEQNSYDDYLAHPTIARLEADSLESLIVYSAVQFDRDSAHVLAEAVFVGPSGRKTRYRDGNTYHFYFRRGRWIHPTISTIHGQLEYEQLRRAAESAAEEETALDED